MLNCEEPSIMPGKHNKLTQCRSNVGPPLRRWLNIGTLGQLLVFAAGNLLKLFTNTSHRSGACDLLLKPSLTRTETQKKSIGFKVNGALIHYRSGILPLLTRLNAS